MSATPSPKISTRTVPLQIVKTLLDDLLERQTDGGAARWFLAKHGDNVRYIHEAKQWAIWDGRRWLPDRGNAIQEFAKDAVQAILDLAPREKNHRRREAIIRLGNRLDTVDRYRRMLIAASTDQRVLTSIEQYDADPWLLNAANGTIDLRDGRLLAHQRDHLLTKIVEVQYDPSALAPTWEGFLARIFRSHPEIVLFMQRAIGYTLTGSTAAEKFFLLHGTGSNGKTTLVETALKLLGDFGLATAADTWLRQPHGRGVPEDIARLKGVRMSATAEIGEGRKLDDERIKGIVTGDRQTARFLHQNSFDFTPTCKLWISTNHKPHIQSADHGIWRRVCLVPFHETISDKEKDLDLRAKLANELEGVLAWAVQGCLAWRRDGLQEPEIVLSTTEEYRNDEDVVAQWVEECCEVESGSVERASSLYRRYTEWAKARGERMPMSANAFGRRLSDRGFAVQKVGGAAFRMGLRLRDDCDAEPQYHA